jgi:hypothetical protein
MTPPVRPQPSVAEWLELEARGLISREELRQQLAINAVPGQVNPVGQELGLTSPLGARP